MRFYLGKYGEYIWYNNMGIIQVVDNETVNVIRYNCICCNIQECDFKNQAIWATSSFIIGCCYWRGDIMN